jgi:undecaprenyl-diphosphatase
LSIVDLFDWNVIRVLDGWATRLPVLDQVGGRLLELKPLFFVFALGVLWTIWFRQGRTSTAVRERVIVTVAGALIALVLGRLLAEALPMRTRPFAVAAAELRPLLSENGGALRTWSSFPSDHAVIVFALAVGIFTLSRRLGACALFLAAAWVCLPRMFFGLHYPTDLIGGALIGVAMMALAQSEALRPRLASPALAVYRRWPMWFYGIAAVVCWEIVRMFEDIRHPVAGAFALLHQG